MADVIINIIKIGSSYYAEEKTVQANQTVEIKNVIANETVKVLVPNMDGYFSNTLSKEESISSNQSLQLGTVTGNGNATKYFSVDPNPYAPPRIIRVQS